MGLSLISGPTLEPVSIAEAKAHCRIDSSDDDGLIAGYILAARSFAEDYTRRAFIQQIWEYSIDFDWPTAQCGPSLLYIRKRIELPKPPLLSVTSITYVDSNGDTQTLEPSQYLVNSKGMVGLVEPAHGVRWPTVRIQMNAITVRFVCGYGSNPGDGQALERIRQAVLLLVGYWYENREAVNVGNITTELPFGVEALLFPLRVFY